MPEDDPTMQPVRISVPADTLDDAAAALLAECFPDYPPLSEIDATTADLGYFAARCAQEGLLLAVAALKVELLDEGAAYALKRQEARAAAWPTDTRPSDASHKLKEVLVLMQEAGNPEAMDAIKHAIGIVERPAPDVVAQGVTAKLNEVLAAAQEAGLDVSLIETALHSLQSE